MTELLRFYKKSKNLAKKFFDVLLGEMLLNKIQRTQYLFSKKPNINVFLLI